MKKCLKITALCGFFVLLLSIMLISNIPKTYASSLDENYDFDGQTDEIITPYFNIDTIVWGSDYYYGVFDFPSSICRVADLQTDIIGTYTTISGDDDYDFYLYQDFSDFDSTNLGWVRNYFTILSSQYMYFMSDEMYFPANYSNIPSFVPGIINSNLLCSVNYKIWFYDEYNNWNYDEISYTLDSSSDLLDETLFTNSKYNSHGYVRITDYVFTIDNNTGSSINGVSLYVHYDYVNENIPSTYFRNFVVEYTSPGQWMLDSLDSFMSFELVPGFSLTTLFTMMVLIPLVLFLCKLFLGG